VAVTCVLVTRLTGFQPGLLFGLVAGYVHLGIDDRQEGRAIGMSAVVLLGFTLGAWWWFDGVAPRAAGADPSLPTLILDAILAVIVVAGIESLVFGLVPLRFLDGQKVLGWSRVVWAGLLAVGLFLFVHVLLAGGYGDLSDASSPAVAAIAFGGYALFSVAFWWYWLRRNRLADGERSEQEEGSAEEAAMSGGGGLRRDP
jgi:hypothetical protein